jgi:hypothetical protein
MVVKEVTKAATSTMASTVKAVSDLVGEHELSWDELCTIEKRRRNILKRTELPFFRILFFWDGTVLRLLVTDALMWITILIYVLMRIGARVGMPDFVSDLGGADIGKLAVRQCFLFVTSTGIQLIVTIITVSINAISLLLL